MLLTIIGWALAGGLLLAVIVLAYTLHVVLSLNREERDHLRADMEREREVHRGERRELITRATHPHLVPTGTTRAPLNSEDQLKRRAALREMASVGRVVHGDPGADDDNGDLPGVP